MVYKRRISFIFIAIIVKFLYPDRLYRPAMQTGIYTKGTKSGFNFRSGYYDKSNSPTVFAELTLRCSGNIFSSDDQQRNQSTKQQFQ